MDQPPQGVAAQVVLRGPRTGGPALLHGEGSWQYVTCDGIVFIVRGEEETPTESLSASLGKEHDTVDFT